MSRKRRPLNPWGMGIYCHAVWQWRAVIREPRMWACYFMTRHRWRKQQGAGV